MNIALCFIFRNSEAGIERMLLSAIGSVEEVVAVNTGSTDGSEEIVKRVCGEHNVPVKIVNYECPHGHEKWIANFSEARQAGWDQVRSSSDFILWLDTDDELMERVDGVTRPGGSEMRRVLHETCELPPPRLRADCLMMRYDYAHDNAGYVVSCQPRIRVCRNGFFHWQEPVHEIACPSRPGKIPDDSPYDLPCWVTHHGAVDKAASAERNKWIIDTWLADGNQVSARIYSGLCDAEFVLGRYEAALSAGQLSLSYPQADDALYRTLVRCGDIHRKFGESDYALDNYARAERVQPRWKAAYLGAAETLLDAGRYEAALVWCQKADMAGDDRESMLFNPQAGWSVPTYVRAKANLELGQFDEALRFYKMLDEAYPGTDEIERAIRGLEHGLRVRDLHESFSILYQAVGPEKQALLVKAAPDEISDMPLVSGFHRPPRPDGKKVLVLHCGMTHNEWDDRSIANGVGGSEESAIYMSQEFVKLGYHIEIYGSPPHDETRVDDHGVVWMPAHSWRPQDTADIFIAWRYPRLTNMAEHCSQRWIWLQDIPQWPYYTEDLCDSVEGILCISEFQSRFLGDHGLKKCVLTANGLDPKLYKDGVNDPKHFIYASSPNRGLLELLQEWPEISHRTGGAILHVFYGFRDIYKRMMEKNASLATAKQEIEKLLEDNADTVIDHGMVGQEELHTWFAQCGYWLYPTSFEEAFCITAAKAQAMGAIPITSRNPGSSLPEVCGRWDIGPNPIEGVKFKDSPEWRKEWVDCVVDASNSDSLHKSWREDMKADARERFPWVKVASQWHRLFSEASQRPPLPHPGVRQEELELAAQQLAEADTP